MQLESQTHSCGQKQWAARDTQVGIESYAQQHVLIRPTHVDSHVECDNPGNKGNQLFKVWRVTQSPCITLADQHEDLVF